MVPIGAALSGIASLAFASVAFAAAAAAQTTLTQDAFAQAPVAAPAEPAADEDNKVTVTRELTERQTIYKLFRELDSNQLCARGTTTPRGYSCAEITYDVFDKNGKFLSKCNVPNFKLYGSKAFTYTVLTFDRFDCDRKSRVNRGLAGVELDEIMNPKTKDNTTFKVVSIMGHDQAKHLCAISSKICVEKLFDREEQLTFDAIAFLWPADSARVKQRNVRKFN